MPRTEVEFDHADKPFTSEFGAAVRNARGLQTLRLSRAAKSDLRDRIDLSVRLLGLPESAEELESRLLGESPFLKHYFGRDSLRD